MKVYVVEAGDYEQRGVVLVCDSFEAGCDAIRRMTPSPPNKVRWREDRKKLQLIADFYEHVPGHHCQTESVYDFTEYEVESAAALSDPKI